MIVTKESRIPALVCPSDLVRETMERNREAAEIKRTRDYLGCKEPCFYCQKGCPHEGKQQ